MYLIRSVSTLSYFVKLRLVWQKNLSYCPCLIIYCRPFQAQKSCCQAVVISYTEPLNQNGVQKQNLYMFIQSSGKNTDFVLYYAPYLLSCYSDRELFSGVFSATFAEIFLSLLWTALKLKNQNKEQFVPGSVFNCSFSILSLKRTT